MPDRNIYNRESRKNNFLPNQQERQWQRSKLDRGKDQDRRKSTTQVAQPSEITLDSL